MDLLERADALAILDGLLGARADGGQVALVSGEAGAGKSALVSAFTAMAAPRARVLWGACDPLLTPRALGPWYDVGQQSGGGLADRIVQGGSRESVLTELLGTLAQVPGGKRSVVVIEDAHWADEATFDTLVYLGRRRSRHHALIVMTYRDDEIDPDHPLRSALAALPREAVHRVPLAPLSPGAVAELARRADRDPTGVHEVTGGNALLVTEVLTSDQPGVPPTVRDLALARLRSLPGPAREAARLVAVNPTRAESSVVAGMTGAVETCLASGVLVPAGDGVAFRHELLRQAVEESISPPRRAELHAAVLQALERAGGVDPARLVHHARHAGDVTAVLTYSRAAAELAAAVGAHREAVGHHRAAQPHLDQLPAVERAELLEAYAFQAYLAGEPDQALEARRRALAARRVCGPPEKVGENLRWVSRLAWWTQRAAEARAAAAQAVEALERLPPGRQLAMAYSNRSQLHMLSYEVDDAVAWGRRAQALARRLGDVETAAHAMINIGSAMMQREDPDGAAMLEDAHAAAAAAGLDDHAARALVNLAFVTVEWGDYVRGADAVGRALRFANERELDGYVLYLLGMRAGVRLESGDWVGARADAEEALTGRGQHRATPVPALVALGRLQARCGEPDALATLDRAAAYARRTGELQRVGPVAAARSEYFLLAGDPRQAADEARRGLGMALEIGHRWFIGELTYRLSCAGASDEVQHGIPSPYRELLGGDWSAAAAEWARRGCRYARAEALGLGDEPAVKEALGMMDGLGATRAAQHLRAELRRRGVVRIPRGPRSATTTNPLGLTSRQLDVLELLADGLTNGQIAERLVVSPKTVDHHVSAILGKLGVASRGQATAAAHRLGLAGPARP